MLPGTRNSRRIGLLDVYAKQVETAEQLRGLRDQLLPMSADHEVRIRALERWRYGLPVAALASIASAVLAVVSLIRR